MPKKNKKQRKFFFIQGGMGVGVSRAPLAGAVARKKGARCIERIGVISTAYLDAMLSEDLEKKVSPYEAVRREIANAKKLGNNGLIGVNIMVAIKGFDEYVKGAISAKADYIFAGAGLPLDLPKIYDQIPEKDRYTKLVPIISSAKAAKIIMARWQKYNYAPPAFILEGPLAGGHLGFKPDQINDPAFKLENLLGEVLKVVGDIPVIVAGGIWTGKDMFRFKKLGASGVQLGSRFMIAKESGASPAYKRAVIGCEIQDIIISSGSASPPGSPCGLPFRVIKFSPFYKESLIGDREPKCDLGFLRIECPAIKSKDYFCICNGLSASAGYNSGAKELWTAGAIAYRNKKIESTKRIIRKLQVQFKWYKFWWKWKKFFR